MENKLNNDLEWALYYHKNQEFNEGYKGKMKTILEEVGEVILKNTRDNLRHLSMDIIARYIELLLLDATRDKQTKQFIDLFFQNYTCQNQFYIRALLATATLQGRKIEELGLKAEKAIEQVKEGIESIKKALEIIISPHNKQKYQFLLYNCSICTWNVIRRVVRPGWAGNVAEIIEKLSTLIEEMDDSDFDWRCRYLSLLAHCLLEGEKKPEALKILDKLWDLTKKKQESSFQELLFRMRINAYRDNSGAQGTLKKEGETAPPKSEFKAMVSLQQIKSGVIPEGQIEKELIGILGSLLPSVVSYIEDKGSLEAVTGSHLLLLAQDRVAEVGRIAIKYGYLRMCEGACVAIQKVRQISLRAKVWSEYTKAELIMKRPLKEIDEKTKMKLNVVEKQISDLERRVESLKIMERAMIANKKLADPDITIEGCIVIWNLALPLLNSTNRKYTYKPFLSAASFLEEIDASENVLRVSIHLELAKHEITEDFLSKAQINIRKALALDYSVVAKKITIPLTEYDDPGLFQRPYEKEILRIEKVLKLKVDIYGEPETKIEHVLLEVENAKLSKNDKMREDVLSRCMEILNNYEEKEWVPDVEADMVPEEIEESQRAFKYNIDSERKYIVLISTEICKQAFQLGLFDLAIESGTLALENSWDPQKDPSLIIAQTQVNYLLSQTYADKLLEEDLEIAYVDLKTLEEEDEEEFEPREFTEEQKRMYAEWKEKVYTHIEKGCEMGLSVRQTWLVYNAAIILWNLYLPVVRLPDFQSKLIPNSKSAFRVCFESMGQMLPSGSFDPDNVDYNLNTKINIYANLGQTYAKLLEHQNQNADAVKVCDDAINKQLPSHLRKAFDAIKARITKQAAAMVAKGGGAPAKAPAGKGGKQPVAVSGGKQEISQSEQVTSEVISLLELIGSQVEKGTGQDLVVKAMESLKSWNVDEDEERELELSGELWSKLGRLACKMNTQHMMKIALLCSESAFKVNGVIISTYHNVPYTRLRWYAVARGLYGEVLAKLVDPSKQETESQEKLLETSIEHFVESVRIASFAQMSSIALESTKQMWNSLLPLLSTKYNRRKLIEPMSTAVTFLRNLRENSDPDFLTLYYAALLGCISESKQWELGEKIVNEAFEFMPNTHHKVLWESKMLYLSKLGKNVLAAISNMKENNPSLQAKVWIKLARSSANKYEQFSAYSKAIEILRKEESIEVVEVLIEFGIWLHRNEYPKNDIEDNLLLAVDLLLEVQGGWEEEEEEDLDEEEAKTRKSSRMSKTSKQSKAKSRLTKKSKTSKMSKGKSRRTATSRVSKSRSKKTKTTFSKMGEEESQPMYLTCSHYEKLLRIHLILSQLSKNTKQQRDYILDAYYFILKIWEESFQTYNSLLFMESHTQELAEMGYQITDPISRGELFAEIFTNNDIKIPIQLICPMRDIDWLKYSFPEEFVSKCKGYEEPNMFCKWAFMKPKLTFTYLTYMLEKMESYYLHIQMIPLLHMLIHFSTMVLGSQELSHVYALKLKRIQMNLGLDENDEDAQQVLAKIKLDQVKQKTYFDSIKNLKEPSDDLVMSTHPRFLYEKNEEAHELEPLKIHEVWLIQAEEILKWGKFLEAKELLEECRLHSRILNDYHTYARTWHFLADITYIEGNFPEAITLDMQCHKFMRKIETILESVCQTSKHLLCLNKNDEIMMMLDNTIKNIKSKISNSTKTSEDKFLSLTQMLGELYIEKALCYIRMSEQSKTDEIANDMFENSLYSIQLFEEIEQAYGCNAMHIIKIIKYGEALYSFVQNKISFDKDKLIKMKIRLETGVKCIVKAQKYIQNMLHYIGISKDSSNISISLPIDRLMSSVKLRLAEMGTTLGIMKQTYKMREKAKKSVEIHQAASGGETAVAVWLEDIGKEIEKANKPVQKRMNRYEHAISVLGTSLNLAHYWTDEYLKIIVQIARSRTWLAINKKHIQNIWKMRVGVKEESDGEEEERENIENTEKNIELEKDPVFVKEEGDESEEDELLDYKSQALQTFIKIIKDKEGEMLTRIIKSVGNSKLEDNLSIMCMNYIECRGSLNAEQTFIFLALYQFAISRQELFESYSLACAPGHRDMVIMRTLQQLEGTFGTYKSPYYCAQYKHLKKLLEEDSKPYININTSFSWSQIMQTLPRLGAYLIVQLSQDWTDLYLGLMKLDKEGAQKIWVRKESLTDGQIDQIKNFIERIQNIKSELIKTPITVEEDMEKLQEECNNEFKKIIFEMNSLFGGFLSPANMIINPVSEVAQEAEEEHKEAKAAGKAPPPKKGAVEKKAAGKPVKGAPKAGKGEMGAYETPLELSTGGVESLILLLDNRLMDLPFEAMDICAGVPVVSRDFSLHMYVKRLEKVGHVGELHNNQGLSKENLHYIVDLPNDQVLTASLKEQVQNMKVVPGTKWEGVLTEEHIPSIGEWQKEVGTSDLFISYSISCILHTLSPYDLSHLSNFSECKAAVLLDRMNTLKPLIDRSSLTNSNYNLGHQPLQLLQLMTLCSTASIISPKWAPTPQQTIQFFSNLVTQMNSDRYLACAINNYRKPIIKEEKILKAVQLTEEEEEVKTGSKKQPPRKATPKGAAAPAKGKKKEEEEYEIKETEVVKRDIDKYNFASYGVPLMRLQ